MAAEDSTSPEPAGSGSFPDRSLIDVSRDPTPGEPGHLAPDDAGERPLIDLSRDPTPGQPDHAAPEDDGPDAAAPEDDGPDAAAPEEVE